jgi:Cu(I)/Ag(I) efflux system membrane protein CusA/SilA
MLSKIIEWSLRNQFIVVVGVIFAVLGGWWAISTTRLDAIPDLSDAQVIIYTKYPGQAPQVVEDQLTYPITSKMLAVPFAKVVRGYSFFGFSFVYVIFEDGTDLYWARSRVLEYLNGLSGQLPDGVAPQLGPDATGVGWAFMYVLNSPQRSLADLRSYQDWYLKYGLMSVDGVSEVASLGGFVRQYQVEVDPVGLRAYGVSLAAVNTAIQRSNSDVGGRLVEMGERSAPAARRSICPTSPTSPSAPRSGAASPTGTARARRWAASLWCDPALTRCQLLPRSRNGWPSSGARCRTTSRFRSHTTGPG